MPGIRGPSQGSLNLEIRVDYGPYGSGFNQSIAAAAEATLQDQDINSGSLTIVLTDEPGIRDYNRRYVGIDLSIRK